jgi:hypothetical protein
MSLQASIVIAALSGVKLIATDAGPSQTNCFKCINRRDVPGNAHIECAKPWHRVSANRHGIENGWFMYPKLFDPVWMTSECPNFSEKENLAVESVGKPM